jgi:opacity protein-like surface antigen
MRKLVFAGLALGALMMPAAAADMALYKAPPPAPYFTWTGFYFGGDVGGAFSSDSAAWTLNPTFGVSATAGDTGGSAFAGGFFAGYNYQFAPSWVAGIEGDWTGMRAGGVTNQPWNAGGVIPGSLTSMSSEVEWAVSLRGRLGYLIWPNLLIYGTGGGAWGKIQYGASLRPRVHPRRIFRRRCVHHHLQRLGRGWWARMGTFLGLRLAAESGISLLRFQQRPECRGGWHRSRRAPVRLYVDPYHCERGSVWHELQILIDTAVCGRGSPGSPCPGLSP